MKYFFNKFFLKKENDIIEAIFKDCGGNLELTIDNLLEINNNNNNNSTSQHDHQQAHRVTFLIILVRSEI